jgi:hypothetical protein
MHPHRYARVDALTTAALLRTRLDLWQVQHSSNVTTPPPILNIEGTRVPFE